MSQPRDGWVNATLNELAVEQGITDGPFGSNLKSEHYTTDGPRVVRLQNIGDGHFRDERAHISDERFGLLQKHSIAAHDVLVASLGEQLPRACLAPASLGPAIVKADCIRIRTNAVALSAYVMWALNSTQVRERVAESIKGVGRPRVNLGDLRSLTLPVPPRAEQERIVTAIEEAFSKLDAGEAGLRTVRQLLKRMREAALASAVSGYLVPRDPNDGQPSKSLAGLEKANLQAEQCPPVEGWAFARLDEVCAVHDCEHRTPKYTVDDGLPALRPRDVVGGRLNLASAARVSQDEFDRQNRRYQLRPGDIAYSRELSLGWAAVLPADRVCLSQGMVAIHPGPSTNAEFVALFLNGAGRRQALAQSAGSAHPHLNLRDIRAFRVPLPPLAEQGRIVAEVDRHMSFIEACERAVDAGLARSSALRRSVLKSAFEGRLVPQDPSDEPASVLLDRIRLSREPSPAKSPSLTQAKPKRRPASAG